jgi:hypothetical protein
MITLEKAIEIARNAHEGQYGKPKTVETDSWDCYKVKEPTIHENGNKIQWVTHDTFLVYEPYITHSLAVMEMMDTEEERINDFMKKYNLNSFVYYDGLKETYINGELV